MGGVCQYHVETMPRRFLRQGVASHPAIFINQTLSTINPVYHYSDSFSGVRSDAPELDSFVNRSLDPQSLT
jgi:hypothetical protein